ncbi:hypothetical protein ACOMHN_060215 [Nucella lapillus]
MGKKMKKDEKPPPVDVFDPLLVESRQAATVVLMLSSPEEDVQSKACEAIYKFVDKCDENKKLLLDLQTLDPLLHLMQGEDATVRRHATMALGVMCQNLEVRRYLRKKEDAVPTLISLLQPEICDLVVNEFAALAVSFMATEFSSKVTIFDNGGVEPLVRLLTSCDPDVQKNSIEALAQLALDFQARGSVREYDGFSPILELLKSDYAIIQKLALLTLDRLMQDGENRRVLLELEGISKLLDFLGRPEWGDLHVMVIMVLASLLEEKDSLEVSGHSQRGLLEEKDSLEVSGHSQRGWGGGWGVVIMVLASLLEEKDSLEPAGGEGQSGGQWPLPAGVGVGGGGVVIMVLASLLEEKDSLEVSGHSQRGWGWGMGGWGVVIIVLASLLEEKDSLEPAGGEGQSGGQWPLPAGVGVGGGGGVVIMVLASLLEEKDSLEVSGHSQRGWGGGWGVVIMVLASLLEEKDSLEQMKESGGLKKLVALITDQPPAEEDSKKGDKKGGSRAGKKSASKDNKGKKGGDDDEKEAMPGGECIILTLPDVKMCAAKAIARCARSSENRENRKILHEQETEKMLIALLGNESLEVQAAAAQAIGVMCENINCRNAIREWEGMPPLVKLISTDNGDVKEAVTLALANLTTANIQNCQEVVNLNGLDAVLGVLMDGREEGVSNAACILTNMAQDEGLRAEAQNKSAITALIDPLRSSNSNVQSKAALAVSAFACDADSRAEFRENGGLEPLVMLLHSGNDEVRKNAAWAITVAGMDESTATEICKLGGLEILQQIQLSSSRQSPFVDAAMDRLLDSNLSAKYALTGHLSSLNLIEDGFYDPGQLKPGSKFRSLEEYLGDPLHDKRPVFYISAKQEVSAQVEKVDDADSKADTKSISGKTTKTSKLDAKGKSKAQREKEEKQKEEELAAQLQKEAEAMAEKDQKPLEPPTDPTFVKCLEDVAERILPLPSIREQIKALAVFVADKMGGAIEKGQLPYFGWELPLSQVRFECKTNVVPIGKIKMGIHTHRALLFKALADRLSIGCTLTRGQYNRAWNQVMLTEEEDTPDVPKYPPRPFIVDLMCEPGRLLSQDSQDYVAYQKI